MTPEYMHLAPLGISKSILSMWMSEARGHGNFNDLHVNIKEVMHCLQSHLSLFVYLHKFA